MVIIYRRWFCWNRSCGNMRSDECPIIKSSSRTAHLKADKKNRQYFSWDDFTGHLICDICVLKTPRPMEFYPCPAPPHRKMLWPAHPQYVCIKALNRENWLECIRFDHRLRALMDSAEHLALCQSLQNNLTQIRIATILTYLGHKGAGLDSNHGVQSSHLNMI